MTVNTINNDVVVVVVSKRSQSLKRATPYCSSKVAFAAKAIFGSKGLEILFARAAIRPKEEAPKQESWLTVLDEATKRIPANERGSILVEFLLHQYDLMRDVRGKIPNFCLASVQGV